MNLLIKLDTDTMKAEVVKMVETTAKPDKSKVTLADAFEPYEGTYEYNGVVEDIQKWYYGKLVKAAWCATSLSYFAEQVGVSDQTGKHESVDRMKDYMNVRGALDCTKLYGGGSYVPKRGDVVFMSSRHSYDDCTHVMTVQDVNPKTGWIRCIGGNTGDMIASREYNYLTDKYIVAFGYIKYD